MADPRLPAFDHMTSFFDIFIHHLMLRTSLKETFLGGLHFVAIAIILLEVRRGDRIEPLPPLPAPERPK